MDLFKVNRVLVIGAHADDEVLGCGGTIARLVANDVIVDVLIITDSVSSQYASSDNFQTIDASRKSSLQKSCELLGVNRVTHLDFPDMKLDKVPHISLNRAVTKELSLYNYDTVFVHHHSDVNLDHQIVFRSVSVCTRPVPGQAVKNVFSYFVPSSTEWGAFNNPQSAFIPNFFVDVSSTMQSKLDAFNFYKDENRSFPHPRSERNLVVVANYYGSMVGLELAEPFVSIRQVV